MDKKVIYFSEPQIKFIKEEILNENREGKNINLVRRFLKEKGYNQETAQKILDNIRTDIPNSRLAQCKFLLGITRMYLDGQLQDGNSIMQLNGILKYIASNAHVNEYDNNLSNLSVNELVNRFKTVQQNDLNQDKENISKWDYQENHRYNIVRIPDFKTANQYSNYTSWCVAHNESMYSTYTNGYIGIFYFCLRDDFETVEKVKGENCPLDDYGLSMIAISVNEDGSLNTCTTRWNHDMEGNDSMMDTKQISELIGRNFYNTFIPRSKEEIESNKKKIFDIFESNIPYLKNWIDEENGFGTNYIGDIEVQFVELENYFYLVEISGKNAIYSYFDENFVRYENGEIILSKDVYRFDENGRRLLLDCNNSSAFFDTVKNKVITNGFEKYAFDFNYPIIRALNLVAFRIKNIQNKPYVVFDPYSMMPLFKDGEFFGNCEVMADYDKMRVILSNKSIRFYLHSDESITIDETSKENITNINELRKYIDFTRPLSYQAAKYIDENAVINISFENENNDKDGSLLVENRESKNINIARKWLKQKGYSQESSQKILDNIRTDIPNSRIAQCKFLLGIARIVSNGELNDYRSISSLNKTLQYIGSDAHVNEYNNDLNGENLQTLINRFSSNVTKDLESDKESIEKEKYQENNNYQIIKINSFEEATKYDKYVDWCVTYSKKNYDSYTNGGYGVFYFCLKNGFENVERKKGEGCPYDEYGLSMIAVSVNEDGSLNTSTTRWNHANGGTDNSFTTQELSKIIGVNFYNTFKPKTEEEIKLVKENAKLLWGHAIEIFNNNNFDAYDEIKELNDNLYIAYLDNVSDNFGCIITNIGSNDGKYHYWPNSDINNLITYSTSRWIGNGYVSLIEYETQKSYVIDENLNLIQNLPNNTFLLSLKLPTITFLYGLVSADFNTATHLINLKNNFIYWNIKLNGKEVNETTKNGVLRIADNNDNSNIVYFDYDKNKIFPSENVYNVYAINNNNFVSDDIEKYTIINNNNNKSNIWVKENNKLALKEWAIEISPYFYKIPNLVLVTKQKNVYNLIDLNKNPYKFICNKDFRYYQTYANDNIEGLILINVDDTISSINLQTFEIIDSVQESTMYKTDKPINENIENEVEPNELSTEPYDKKNELNPKLWGNGNTLNPKVRMKLLDIADEFWFGLNLDWVDVKDIIITGSICNFNWSPYSDIDLHILIDYLSVDENKDLVTEFFNSKKNEWNDEHLDLSIYGFPVEIYVQDINEPHVSSGIYSLEKNTWLLEPSKDKISPIDGNSDEIKDKAAMLMTIIDNLERKILIYKNDSYNLEILSDKVNSFISKLKKMRKKSLSEDGEMSVGNLVYKLMRQKGYVDKIYKLKYMAFDYLNSL